MPADPHEYINEELLDRRGRFLTFPRKWEKGEAEADRARMSYNLLKI